jgi:hypothetical protein
MIDSRMVDGSQNAIRNVRWAWDLKEMPAGSIRHFILLADLLQQAANENGRMNRRSPAEVVNLMAAGNSWCNQNIARVH